MANPPKFYELLRSDRDDAARARALDEWRATQPTEVRIYCDDAIRVLRIDQGLGENQAKALLCVLILFMHMKTDEQDKWRSHGEYIRAQHEWMLARISLRNVEVLA